ncbi:MAG: hypothetical protein ACXWDO_10835 [Bacteroidia bacterium]
MENNDIHNELQDLNSPLAKMEKKHPFDVPVNYFEEMPSAIQSHIYDRKKMPSVFALPNFWIRWVPAFAIVLVFFGIALYMLSQKNASVQDNVFVSNNTEIEQVADAVSSDVLLDEIDEELLVEAYKKTEKTEPKIAAEKQEITVSDAELEEYILENYDESLLIEEL